MTVPYLSAATSTSSNFSPDTRQPLFLPPISLIMQTRRRSELFCTLADAVIRGTIYLSLLARVLTNHIYMEVIR